MIVVPFVVTYNGMGTGSSIKRCVEFLMADGTPSFGAAIEEVDLYAHCHTREPLIESLASMHERFEARLPTLPYLKFRRKARLFEIAFPSRFLHDESLFGSDEVTLSSAHFDCLCREFAAAMFLIRRRITSSDAFDIDGLESHLQRRLELLR